MFTPSLISALDKILLLVFMSKVFKKWLFLIKLLIPRHVYFFKNQDMKKHVNEEVTEFLKFLQNSAKKCAQDYNMLSEDARLFTEVKQNKKQKTFI